MVSRMPALQDGTITECKQFLCYLGSLYIELTHSLIDNVNMDTCIRRSYLAIDCKFIKSKKWRIL